MSSMLKAYRAKHPKKPCATPNCKYTAVPRCKFCLGCRDVMLGRVDKDAGTTPLPIRTRETGRRENRTETKGKA